MMMSTEGLLKYDGSDLNFHIYVGRKQVKNGSKVTKNHTGKKFEKALCLSCSFLEVGLT